MWAIKKTEGDEQLISVGRTDKGRKRSNNQDCIFVSDAVLDYIVALVANTRKHADLDRGASPRATLALTSMAKAYAYLCDRNFVIPSDVQAVFNPVMGHRLILTPEAEVNEKSSDEIAKAIIHSTAVPKV